MRLKNIVNRERFDWVAFDESRPLPVSVPSMPLKLKVILVGERESLADFREMEPELSEQAIYSEFEDTLQIVDAESVSQWCRWVTFTARHNHLPAPGADARRYLSAKQHATPVNKKHFRLARSGSSASVKRSPPV